MIKKGIVKVLIKNIDTILENKKIIVTSQFLYEEKCLHLKQGN